MSRLPSIFALPNNCIDLREHGVPEATDLGRMRQPGFVRELLDSKPRDVIADKPSAAGDVPVDLALAVMLSPTRRNHNP